MLLKSLRAVFKSHHVEKKLFNFFLLIYSEIIRNPLCIHQLK